MPARAAAWCRRTWRTASYWNWSKADIDNLGGNPAAEVVMVDTERELDRFHDLELDGWRRLAAGYARYFEPLVSQSIASLLAAARVKQGDRVLDLCCGPGYVSAQIERRGATPV